MITDDTLWRKSFVPLKPHRVRTYRSYVRAIDKDTWKNTKTSNCLMYDYKRSFPIQSARFQVEIWRVQVSITRVRIVYWNVPAANQPLHTSAKETIHLSLVVTLVVHLYACQRKRKNQLQQQQQLSTACHLSVSHIMLIIFNRPSRSSSPTRTRATGPTRLKPSMPRPMG